MDIKVEKELENNNNKCIYIVISQTETGFAKRIRKYGHVKYNHASIALDKDLTEMYGFARTEQYGCFVATLVKETTDRLTVNAPDGIGIAVFEIPVTNEQYDWVKSEIVRIMEDPSIRYNLFSVLTYPMIKGFSSKKSFTCIEFIMYVLQGLGAELHSPIAKYRPDQLLDYLDKYLIFEGNLLDYTPIYTRSENYFSPVSFKLIRASVKAFAIMSYRSLGTLGRYIKNKIAV